MLKSFEFDEFDKLNESAGDNFCRLLFTTEIHIFTTFSIYVQVAYPKYIPWILDLLK